MIFKKTFLRKKNNKKQIIKLQNKTKSAQGRNDVHECLETAVESYL